MKTCSCSCHNTMNNFLIKDKEKEKEKKNCYSSRRISISMQKL